MGFHLRVLDAVAGLRRGLPAGAVALGAGFTAYAWQLWRSYSDALARRTFRFSIYHLMLLFGLLILDHHWLWRLS